jgi:integrase
VSTAGRQKGPKTIILCSPPPTSRHSCRANVYRRVLQPAREAADLPWVGFHVFRHTYATLLFAEGATPLARGLPGTDRERAEQRRRFAEEHRETLRRLGK